MSRGLLGLAAALVFAAPAPPAPPLDLANWALRLPTRYAAHGVKSEPTYQEALDLRRDGDVFAVTGGAPGWERRLTESLSVARDGAILRVPCAQAAPCRVSEPPLGFLSGAALLSAQRRGRLAGFAQARPFGRWRVICVDAAHLGVREPILDPCFEVRTGAPIAQRHRATGKFDGPSLDAHSLIVD